ncbi:uncharacterized protein MELLADRAFT_112143 [Melampsora larici-populina 98AG31]|uniref:Uncharacterized protein n=1 Tax=Melampsora larici-populina (strain 98AG31 / pathotype 3-4-7) TaxID=747676 RepID=F4S5I8_MELLP|nr:uncharacterized protein MELLADRAFT_112143 [Melampsora larici-populina 98AG31]EGG00032.1 hypothetical protein MELLADRAFT_112143 [Melampsora larici-populina 98AG31]
MTHLVPKPPKPELLLEFNSRFSNSSTAKIEGVIDSTTANDIINQNDVQFPSAHRVNVGGSIVNIKEFFWVAAKAFAYMNINKTFVNKLLLLKKTYNHYVHYWYGQKYRREVKEEGINQATEERRNALARRKRLQKARSKHAKDHNFSPRYQRILSKPEAHSNDEWSPKLQAYIANTPEYRSVKAGLFIRRVDDHT